jgi:hypothetical protein
VPPKLGNLGSIVVKVLGRPAAITVTRRTGAHVDGTWTANAPTVFALAAAVHPMAPQDIAQLPEGERIDEAIQIFSVEKLWTSDVEGAAQADEVEWNGKTWTVDRLDDWTVDAAFCHAIAVRMRA